MVHPNITRIDTIGAYHKLVRLPPPTHPLISVIRYEDVRLYHTDKLTLINNFYSIGLKRNSMAHLKYGDQTCNYEQGKLTFMAPGQLFEIEVKSSEEFKHTGWLVLFDQDFLWNTSLATKIQRYDFFNYFVQDALYLSQGEEAIITTIIGNIKQEYRTAHDRFSQEIIVAQLESMLAYALRLYHRQYQTKKAINHQLLTRFDFLIRERFHTDLLLKDGFPTVTELADKLHVSTTYLSTVLRNKTGMNTKQHIHEHLIIKAKELLTTTNLSVSEVAYRLGFTFSQSFCKLFKMKTGLSPQSFQQSFDKPRQWYPAQIAINFSVVILMPLLTAT